MSGGGPLAELSRGDFGKYLRVQLGMGSMGVSEALNAGAEASKPMESMSDLPQAPTIEDAKKKVAEDPNSMLRTKTYGRMGTIMNQGGQRGIASSMLNLTSPTLLGK